MEDEKSLPQVIAEKSGMLNSIIQAKFGGNPSATASSGQETETGGGNTMKVTRSAASNAPGEVQDGKLINVRQLAAAAARQDIPPTDLLALARASDPHNETVDTIAGVITAAEGLPGQEVAQDNSNTGALGNVETTQKEMLHNKQHPSAEKAVNTKVESQVGTTEPYKNLHASAEIEQIVSRAQAILSGADQIRKAATEVPANPGVGKTEDGGQGKVSGDPAKNPEQSAKTLGDGGAEKAASLSGKTQRGNVIAAVRAEIARRAKVEGALIDPAGGPAAQEPEAAAKSMGDGGKEKSAAAMPWNMPACNSCHKAHDPAEGPLCAKCQQSGAVDPYKKSAAAVTAEKRDRPVAQMPENKQRYKADDDNRDEEASSYWEKNRKDEKRFDKEPSTDRPITRELQKKLPSLEGMRRELFTRIAGLQSVLAASDDAAARLHLKRRHYKQDECGDMDFAGAAGKTKGEISTEHTERANDTHPYSPMMSRLWAAYGPVKTAADTGYEGKLGKPEGRDEMRKQVTEWKTALKGIKSEDEGADRKMQGLEGQIEKGEKELAKASDIAIGLPFAVAMANTLDRLAVVAAALGDIGDLAEESHEEVKSSKDKPHGTGTSDSTLTLLEDLGETVEDMEETIDKLLKEMGHPGLKKHKKEGGKEHGEGGEGPEHKGPPMPDIPAQLPGAGEGGAPDFGAEDALVEQMASDARLNATEKRAAAIKARGAAEWKAQFTKMPSKADASKADVLASYWEVIRNGETMLKVSVAEAYPMKTAEKQAEAFAWVATKEYGRKLLASAKFDGLGKTARLLGVAPMVRSAGAFDGYPTKRPSASGPSLDGSGPEGLEGKDLAAYYTKAFGSAEFARELVKQHEQKSAMAKELQGLKQKVAAEAQRSDRLQKDMQMRAKAVRALELAEAAMAKGLLVEGKKAAFIDQIMVGGDEAFAATATIVEGFEKAAAPVTKLEVKASGTTTAKELVRMAAAGGGLKTAMVLPASSTEPVGLASQLGSIWRVPPVPGVKA